MIFEERISQAVSGKLNDGSIDELINNKLEEAVAKTLDDTLGWNGKGRELLKSKVEDILIPCIERHDFNQYLVKLDTCLTEMINNTSLADNKTILENFKGLMKEPEFKTIKLSEIFEKYCECVASNVNTSNLEAVCEDGEPYYEHVSATLDVNCESRKWFSSSSEDCIVTLNCDEDPDLNCEMKLYRNESDRIWRILKCCGSVDINTLRYMNGFEVFMHMLERAFIRIELDTHGEYYRDIEPEEKPEWDLS